jgi:hypothetical protein
MNSVCPSNIGILSYTVRLKLLVAILSRSQQQRSQQAPSFSENTTQPTPTFASNMLNQCTLLQSNTHRAITLQTIPQIVNHVLITLSSGLFFYLLFIYHLCLFIANGSWYAAAGWYPSSTVSGNFFSLSFRLVSEA